MKKLHAPSALIGALLAVVITLAVAAATASRPNWEYRVVTARAFSDELTKRLNAEIGDGWEFVSVTGPNDQGWGIAVLRREKARQ